MQSSWQTFGSWSAVSSAAISFVRGLLDITDAGRYLSMSDKGIRELIVRGELPYVQKVPGRSPYLLDLRDLDSWVEKNKRRP